MKQISSIEQLRTVQTEIRQKRIGFISNFYIDTFKHEVWIRNGDLFIEAIGDTVFFIRKSSTFWNVFYNTTDLFSLERDLRLFSEMNKDVRMMFDVVGRQEQCIPILEKFHDCGYHETVSLVRMIRITEIIEENELFENVKIATKSQAKEVFDLLHRYFVAENEQIPYLEELESYAELGHIHVITDTDNEQVIGFMIYEQNSSTLYWRYWFVHPNYRDKHIGSILFHRLFFEANQTKRQLLWVIRTNENAKKRQEHYGFKEENMFDYVLTNKPFDFE